MAKIIGCDHSTIDNLLNSANVPRYTNSEWYNNPIILSKDDKSYIFPSPKAAAEWMITNNITKSKNLTNVRQYISNYATGYRQGKYFGFEIKYENKI